MKYPKFCLFILSVSLSSCFQLFEKEKKLLAEIDIDAQCKVEASLVTTGATTEDVIQLMVVTKSKSRLIAVYKSYNWVELTKLPSDSLMIQLSDSNGIQKHIDTQYVKLSCS